MCNIRRENRWRMEFEFICTRCWVLLYLYTILYNILVLLLPLTFGMIRQLSKRVSIWRAETWRRRSEYCSPSSSSHLVYEIEIKWARRLSQHNVWLIERIIDHRSLIWIVIRMSIEMVIVLFRYWHRYSYPITEILSVLMCRKWCQSRLFLYWKRRSIDSIATTE